MVQAKVKGHRENKNLAGTKPHMGAWASEAVLPLTILTTDSITDWQEFLHLWELT